MTLFLGRITCSVKDPRKPQTKQRERSYDCLYSGVGFAAMCELVCLN